MRRSTARAEPDLDVHTLIIRTARPGDAPVLSALAQRAKAHWGYPPEWLEHWRPQLTITSEQLIEHRVLVAERAREVVGFAVLLDAGSHWELEHLWVDPPVHGSGVGRALFTAIIKEAAQQRVAPIRIESDPYAAGFYERCGARRVGTAPTPVLGEARELPVLEYRFPDAPDSIADGPFTMARGDAGTHFSG